MEKDILKIAQEYGRKAGYDIVSSAGERNGYKYFDIINESLIGRKTGLPRIIKISLTGRILPVDNLAEIMWATKQKNAIKSASK